MPRLPRVDVGNYIYHIINRATARVPIFYTEEDYDLFELALEEAQVKFTMRILTYCVMPNHWHLVLYPRKDGDISKFMKWLTGTHTQRWHALHHTIGSGHLYQGRYKSFIVENGNYLLSLCKYVESNPLRANLIARAEDWKWSGLSKRLQGSSYISDLPMQLPPDYVDWVNEEKNESPLKEVQLSIERGRPLGTDEWVENMIEKFKLHASIRPEGRPRRGT